MAQQSIGVNDVLNTGRTKINANFTEVYARGSYRGYWDASSDLLPSDDVQAGDEWAFSVGGTFDSEFYPPGTIAKAKEAAPGQDLTKWRLI